MQFSYEGATFIFQTRKPMYTEVNKLAPGEQRISTTGLNSAEPYIMYSFYYTSGFSLNYEILWSSNYKAFPPYFPRTLLPQLHYTEFFSLQIAHLGMSME